MFENIYFSKLYKKVICFYFMVS
uniref:Uncharacterized protein n=1 Tax=Anguilla anguilla TaxID=7936 RepID=A0A0E9STM1_ANGAN